MIESDLFQDSIGLRIPRRAARKPQTSVSLMRIIVSSSILADFPHQGIAIWEVAQTAIVDGHLKHMSGIPFKQLIPVIVR